MMRWISTLMLGAAMFVVGAWVAFRPLFTHGATFTGSRWLDMVFAAAFLMRGALNVKTALRRRQQMMAQG